jgi:hypothetical protein
MGGAAIACRTVFRRACCRRNYLLRFFRSWLALLLVLKLDGRETSMVFPNPVKSAPAVNVRQLLSTSPGNCSSRTPLQHAPGSSGRRRHRQRSCRSRRSRRSRRPRRSRCSSRPSIAIRLCLSVCLYVCLGLGGREGPSSFLSLTSCSSFGVRGLGSLPQLQLGTGKFKLNKVGTDLELQSASPSAS